MKLQARYAAASAVAFLFSAAAQAADPNICVACHGDGGNSTNPAVPSIAQQPAQFISTSLFMFREGNRKNDLMTPMAKPLSNAEMNDLAAYFSSLKPSPPKHKASAESAAAGPALADKFMCTQCHGPALLGTQHIPRVAGQLPDYLRTQLKGFKASKRFDMDGNMTSAAQALTEKDIEILADYLGGLVVP